MPQAVPTCSTLKNNGVLSAYRNPFEALVKAVEAIFCLLESNGATAAPASFGILAWMLGLAVLLDVIFSLSAATV